MSLENSLISFAGFSATESGVTSDCSSKTGEEDTSEFARTEKPRQKIIANRYSLARNMGAKIQKNREMKYFTVKFNLVLGIGSLEDWNLDAHFDVAPFNISRRFPIPEGEAVESDGVVVGLEVDPV